MMSVEATPLSNCIKFYFGVLRKNGLSWSGFVDDNCVCLDLHHQVVAFNDFAQPTLAVAVEVAFNV